ncbi:MAG TPA: hypothetical protein V6D21_19600 [Candidatus Obscuribacterales bacterium]
MENQQNINKENKEISPKEESLGIKNPLLTPKTLGQNFLSLQSISPLGSRSINLIDWSLISPNQTLLQNFQDHENWGDSDPVKFKPFTPNLLTKNSPIIEPPSDKNVSPSIPIQPSSELSVQQQTETPSSDSELPIQQQTETIFPFRIDQKTRKNSVIQNSKNSTSHFFQKKSEFPREKTSQEPVNKSTKKPTENQEISTTEESVFNSTETDYLPTINPTDISTPEISNSSPLQKQPDSTINPTDSSDFTDITTPEIPDSSSIQKQSDSIINPTETSDSTDIATPTINPTDSSDPTDIARPEIPVSHIQKQTESQTVKQLLRQPGAISKLPQVLENLTTSKPLGISQSLVQTSKLISETSFLETNPMLAKDEDENVLDDLDQFASSSRTNIKPKSEPIFNNKLSKQGIMIQQQESDFSTSDVPDSWSSIEELLGESNSTPSEPTVVQAFSTKEGQPVKERKNRHQMSDIRTGMLLPPGISRGVTEVHSLDLQQQPTSVKALMEKTIQTRLQQEQNTASRKAEPVQTLTRSNIGLEKSQVSLISEAQKEETKQAETKTDQVEILAREIYGLVRQRFEIERERQGSSYDRRLF